MTSATDASICTPRGDTATNPHCMVFFSDLATRTRAAHTGDTAASMLTDIATAGTGQPGGGICARRKRSCVFSFLWTY